jgi:FkbM family methyltransferase
VLREIYLESEYPDDLGIVEPEVIVDLGANVGYTLLDFRLRYPNARLIGLEPDPVAFHTLRLNTAADPNISVLPLAIAGADGLREFYSSSESVVSGFERTRDFQTPITVPTRSLDTLMKELGLARIDLLKIDVEGAEVDVLRGAASLLGRRAVGALLFEVSLPQIEALGHDGAEPFAILDSAAYDCFTLTPRGTVGERVRAATDRYANYVALPRDA